MKKINFRSPRYYQFIRSLKDRKLRRTMLIALSGANQQQQNSVKRDIENSINKVVNLNLKSSKIHSLLGRNSNFVLFFDEADALFGKRSKVAVAHDQYANQEVSYLLSTRKKQKGIALVSLKKQISKSSDFDICIQFSKKQTHAKFVSSFLFK